MATIRERRPGVWEVRSFAGRDPTGKPVQQSRTVRGTKKDAQRLAAEMTIQPSYDARQRTSVGDMLDLWVDNARPSWAPATESNQLSRVKLIKADRIASIPLARLTPVDVDRWHSRLVKSGVGDGSIRNQHQALRAAVTLAVRWAWLPTNVVSVANLGRRKTQPRGSLTTQQVRDVLTCAGVQVSKRHVEPQASLALRLAAVTGARRAELAALRWDDVQLGRITIDSSIAILRGEIGGTKPLLRDDPTKTANRRVISLDPTTLNELNGLRAKFEPYGPWILSAGPEPVNPERIGAWWRRARDAANVDPKWRLHDLRHWSATTAIAEGHDIRTVANRLGHANPSMTLRTYAHAVESTDAPIASALGLALDEEITSP